MPFSSFQQLIAALRTSPALEREPIDYFTSFFKDVPDSLSGMQLRLLELMNVVRSPVLMRDLLRYCTKYLPNDSMAYSGQYFFVRNVIQAASVCLTHEEILDFAQTIPKDIHLDTAIEALLSLDITQHEGLIRFVEDRLSVSIDWIRTPFNPLFNTLPNLIDLLMIAIKNSLSNYPSNIHHSWLPLIPKEHVTDIVTACLTSSETVLFRYLCNTRSVICTNLQVMCSVGMPLSTLINYLKTPKISDRIKAAGSDAIVGITLVLSKLGDFDSAQSFLRAHIGGITPCSLYNIDWHQLYAVMQEKFEPLFWDFVRRSLPNIPSGDVNNNTFFHKHASDTPLSAIIMAYPDFHLFKIKAASTIAIAVALFREKLNDDFVYFDKKKALQALIERSDFLPRSTALEASLLEEAFLTPQHIPLLLQLADKMCPLIEEKRLFLERHRHLFASTNGYLLIKDLPSDFATLIVEIFKADYLTKHDDLPNLISILGPYLTIEDFHTLLMLQDKDKLLSYPVIYQIALAQPQYCYEHYFVDKSAAALSLLTPADSFFSFLRPDNILMTAELLIKVAPAHLLWLERSLGSFTYPQTLFRAPTLVAKFFTLLLDMPDPLDALTRWMMMIPFFSVAQTFSTLRLQMVIDHLKESKSTKNTFLLGAFLSDELLVINGIDLERVYHHERDFDACYKEAVISLQCVAQDEAFPHHRIAAYLLLQLKTRVESCIKPDNYPQTLETLASIDKEARGMSLFFAPMRKRTATEITSDDTVDSHCSH